MARSPSLRRTPRRGYGTAPIWRARGSLARVGARKQPGGRMKKSLTDGGEYATLANWGRMIPPQGRNGSLPELEEYGSKVFMRNAYSYEGILSAIGRALDDAAVQRVAIKDTGDGLVVEGFDATGQAHITLNFDVPALFDLIETERVTTVAPSAPASDGTLRRFLARHELVGAR